MSISIGYDEGGNYYVDYFTWQDETHSIEIHEQIEGKEVEENYEIECLPNETYEDEHYFEINEQLDAQLEGYL